MRIAVVFRADYHDGKPVPAYPWSYVEAFQEMGHEVEVVHPAQPQKLGMNFDFALEIENGRDEAGSLRFVLQEIPFIVPSAVLFYDTHGYPDLHAEVAKSYDHVFFGTWVKRDLFAGHPSAHWCPSATDLKWFGTPEQLATEPEFDVGFFGSKRGLERAKDMVEICKRNGWTYDVRQVASNRRVRWPATGNAMAKCRVLFNRGQKHDSPNLRCIESMAMCRPLISNADPRSGMDQLFNDYPDYWGYQGPIELEHGMRVLMEQPKYQKELADNARAKVEAKHLVKHRAQQILEVVGA